MFQIANISIVLIYVFDAVLDSFERQKAGTIDRLAIVVRTPRRAVDVNVVAIVAERGRLDQIGDLAVQHAYAADARVVGHAHAAYLVVGDGGYLARTPRAMSIESKY